ncbi:fatty-acid peroxygenase [Pullulanibacillus camelliae]|uniref:Fatty-acid peroxygenase n=1 Tax=Pullulanibacillus camelliae TaxID=1707096 RepID=A0A8J2YG77_9BACL|nr:cytochrome P450 [Pullulanibacillus camelliae]GGE33189.1 fatty-acid peroxygenase [Pullulanibacillus camelliae]
MPSKQQAPKDQAIDSTLDILREGYLFVQNRCRELQSNIFQTRLLGKEAICISGKEAVKIFYDNEKIERHGSVPKRIQKTLFGENAIQTLDGTKHSHRKDLFLSLMTSKRLDKLKKLTRQEWNESLNKWVNQEKVILFDAVQDLLCRISCKWAGIPLEEAEVKERARDFGNMVDAFGAVGPRHWRGRKARQRSEEWITTLVDQIRRGDLSPSEETPAHVMAFYRDPNGQLLDSQMAAIELINILRPIVAVANYITFEALALHTYPEYLPKLRDDKDLAHSQWFVQEVRRFYPFTPFLGAHVKQDFEWENQRFKQGTMVILDAYGTNHDPVIWESPEQFNPERFKHWESDPYSYIPQGGGDPSLGHRCPGEAATIDIMKVSLDVLVNGMKYDVPEDQDLTVDLVKMPTVPKSGFIIRDIWKKAR